MELKEKADEISNNSFDTFPKEFNFDSLKEKKIDLITASS